VILTRIWQVSSAFRNRGFPTIESIAYSEW
jgi:hypothetical protein